MAAYTYIRTLWPSMVVSSPPAFGSFSHPLKLRFFSRPDGLHQSSHNQANDMAYVGKMSDPWHLWRFWNVCTRALVGYIWRHEKMLGQTNVFKQAIFQSFVKLWGHACVRACVRVRVCLCGLDALAHTAKCLNAILHYCKHHATLLFSLVLSWIAFKGP